MCVNVAKIALALKTKLNYLEMMTKLLVGAEARTSINGHVGRSLGKILDMTGERVVTQDEMNRLVAVKAEWGTECAHIELCKFHARPGACRLGDDCPQLHTVPGAQTLDADNEWLD